MYPLEAMKHVDCNCYAETVLDHITVPALFTRRRKTWIKDQQHVPRAPHMHATRTPYLSHPTHACAEDELIEVCCSTSS